MSNPRFGSGTLLGLTLAGALVGLGLGYVLAPGGGAAGAADPGREAELMPADPSPRAAAAARSDAMQLPTDDGLARDLASGVASDRPQVSEARLKDALASLDLPRAAASVEQGSGTIRGTVVDASGAPIAGVSLLVFRNSTGFYKPRTSAGVGAGPPDDQSLEDALEQAAESWASQREGRRRTLTDSAGAFEVTGLGDHGFSFRAHKAGWVITAEGQSTGYPGDELRFRGMRVHEFVLDVRMPDGSPAEEVVVEVTLSKRPSKYSWSTDEPTLRVGGERFMLTVFGEVFEPRGYRNGTASLYRSEPLAVDLAEVGQGPLLVQLEPRHGIRGRVLRAWSSDQGDQVMVAAIPSREGFDPKQAPPNGESLYAQRGQFLALDLEPGLHVVGIRGQWSGSSQPLEHHQFVEVTSGLVDVELTVTAPTVDEHIVVHCLDPNGRPIEGVDFRYQSTRENGSSSGGVQPTRAPGGAYWVPVSELRMTGDYDNWPAGTGLTLTATTSIFGSRVAKLSSGQRELTLHFARPVSLTVSIAGYADRDANTSLAVRVMDPEAGDNGQPIAQTGQARGFSGFGGGGDTPSISSDGTVVFPAISPGLWDVELVMADSWGRGGELDSLRVEIGSADASAQLTLPMLHELLVYAPDLEPGTFLQVQMVEDDSPRHVAHNVAIGEDLRARFPGLRAGNYKLTAYGGRSSAEVSVPGSEVVFEPKLPDLRISISDEKGLFHLAGLRAGDRIAAVDGGEIGSFWTVINRIQSSEVTLTVDRDGQLLDFTLGPTKTKGAQGGSIERVYD